MKAIFHERGSGLFVLTVKTIMVKISSYGNKSYKLKKQTLSTVVFCLQTIFAVPISPLVENFTPSFVTDITTTKTHQDQLWHYDYEQILKEKKTS